MLTGTARLDTLLRNIPTIDTFETDPVELPNVEIFQANYEMAAHDIQSFFPPALDATIPPLGQWTCWNAPQSPWGAFRLVTFRISCRSGARPRAFVLASCVDNVDARDAFSKHWGLRSDLAEVSFQRNYESFELSVRHKSKDLMSLRGNDPDPLSTGDVQFFASMHAARTDRGLRLIQFDPHYESVRAERYVPLLRSFDAAYWGGGQAIEPAYPVTAYGTQATVHLVKVRFLCRPEVSAFEGSEIVE